MLEAEAWILLNDTIHQDSCPISRASLDNWNSGAMLFLVGFGTRYRRKSRTWMDSHANTLTRRPRRTWVGAVSDAGDRVERLSRDTSSSLRAPRRAARRGPTAVAESANGCSREYLVGGQWVNRFYRPQDEYCEWRVERDEDGRIVKVTFTSEPPEFWQALHGDTIRKEDDEGEDSPFEGKPSLVRDLYREYVNPAVELDDLRCPTDLYSGRDSEKPLYRRGEYNPYNRWNTTDGIMHLTHPANTLRAEIRLGADATVLRQRDDRLVADPDTLIARAGYGGNNRCSDPTIGASVNHLASLGFGITLANPVGLYMDHLDMTGWTTPRGETIDEGWFTVVRGAPGLIERAVFEVPSGEGFKVSDLKIGGELIRFGGQLAERMTVKLVGLAALGAGFRSKPAALGMLAWAQASNPWMVSSTSTDDPRPDGTVPIFDYPEARSAARESSPAVHPAPTHPFWSRAS